MVSRRIVLLAAAALVGGAAFAQAAPSSTPAKTTAPAGGESPFTLVMLDTESEKHLGGFPPDRKLVAEAVNRLAAAGARGVVLKFFYDHAAKTPASDNALAAAMTKLPVALQAGMDDNEILPNELPARFAPDRISGDYRRALTGRSGWIPVTELSKVAAEVGFVDVSGPDRVPAIENYQGRPVKSLTLVALEMATGERAQIVSGENVQLGKSQLKLDADNQIVLRPIVPGELTYIPFHELLDGKVDTHRLHDKVVVIGYDGNKMHALTTAAGPIKAHRLFYLGLLDAFGQLAAR
jgi:CHASE2 domain-containing sensor protein